MEGPAFWYRPLTWPVTYLVFVINPFQNSPPPILTRCQVPSQPRPCFPSVYGPSSACRNIFLYHINFFRPRVLVAWLHHATFSSWPFLAFRKPKRDAHNSYGHDFSLLFFGPGESHDLRRKEGILFAFLHEQKGRFWNVRISFHQVLVFLLPANEHGARYFRTANNQEKAGKTTRGKMVNCVCVFE